MRSSDILSKVVRNLKLLGMQYDTTMDEEIYREMTVAQDKIISELYPTQIISITLSEGIDKYLLTTDTANPKTRQNINSIKIINHPVGSKYLIKSNAEYYDAINNQRNIPPNVKICTVINNRLYIYPIPDNNDNNTVINLIVYLTSSKGRITDTSEPEVPEIFDKAIEVYATSQFAGQEKAQYLAEFYDEIRRFTPKFKNDYNLVKKPIDGWW